MEIFSKKLGTNVPTGNPEEGFLSINNGEGKKPYKLNAADGRGMKSLRCMSVVPPPPGVYGTRHKLQGSQYRSDHTQIYLIFKLKQESTKIIMSVEMCLNSV